jgi:hypothetical protein
MCSESNREIATWFTWLSFVASFRSPSWLTVVPTTINHNRFTQEKLACHLVMGPQVAVEVTKGGTEQI